jgi:hypothetical protein
MVNYHLHENGWTVILDYFDLTATQEDADQISHLLSTNIAVIARNQEVIRELTPEDSVRFCGTYRRCVYEYDQAQAFGRAVSLGTDGAERKIQRVTATRNEEGHPGLFGQDDELDWHCNKPGQNKSFIGCHPELRLMAVEPTDGHIFCLSRVCLQ